MRRVLVVVGLVCCSVFVEAPARAGGGCHGGGAASGSGTTVELAMNCMNPRVLRAAGDSAEVTFVNRDGATHNLYGDGWGVDELTTGKSTTQIFGAGTHVYACTLHPGMVGAVVVGDGVGSETAAAVRPVRAVPAAATSGGGSSGWIFGALAGLILGSTATSFMLRARTRRVER